MMAAAGVAWQPHNHSSTTMDHSMHSSDVQVQFDLKANSISVVAITSLPLTPSEAWSIMFRPEGASIFRVDSRQTTIQQHDGFQEEVTFVAPIRVLFWKTWAKTTMLQQVHTADPTQVATTFDLLKSDLMNKLAGSMLFKQVQPASPRSTPVTSMTYQFSMWPKGVPPQMRYVPGVIEAVKASVKSDVEQLLDKVVWVAGKVGPQRCITTALKEAALEVQLAGGSFKKHKKAAALRSTRSTSYSGCSEEAADVEGSAPSLRRLQTCPELPAVHHLSSLGAGAAEVASSTAALAQACSCSSCGAVCVPLGSRREAGPVAAAAPAEAANGSGGRTGAADITAAGPAVQGEDMQVQLGRRSCSMELFYDAASQASDQADDFWGGEDADLLDQDLVGSFTACRAAACSGGGGASHGDQCSSVGVANRFRAAAGADIAELDQDLVGSFTPFRPRAMQQHPLSRDQQDEESEGSWQLAARPVLRRPSLLSRLRRSRSEQLPSKAQLHITGSASATGLRTGSELLLLDVEANSTDSSKGRARSGDIVATAAAPQPRARKLSLRQRLQQLVRK